MTNRLSIKMQEVVHNISDRSDSDLFKEKCIKLIYSYVRKIRIKLEYSIDSTVSFNIMRNQEKKDDIKKIQLFDMLSKLSFEERYIIVLFCWQSFSLKQIAKTICRPIFITKKREFGGPIFMPE